MKFLKYFALFLVVFIIETNVIDIISIRGITPDVILIFLIFVSLKEPQTIATLFGFGSGLFQDVFTSSLFGLNSLSKSLVCFLASSVQRLKGQYSISYLSIIFFMMTVIHDRIYQFVFLLGTEHQFFKSFLWYTIPKAVYTTVIALIINFIFYKVIWQTGHQSR